MGQYIPFVGYRAVYSLARNMGLCMPFLVCRAVYSLIWNIYDYSLNGNSYEAV